MNTDQQIQAIEQKVKTLIGPDPASFLVEIKISPGNNIKVFIDGDNGVSIDKLVRYNRGLYKQIEECGLFPNGDFSLEVSSPGLDEPLKLRRQYQKNIGRYVEVILKEGSKKEGKLVSVSDDEVVLEEERGKNKKKEYITHIIANNDIKTTKIQIKF